MLQLEVHKVPHPVIVKASSKSGDPILWLQKVVLDLDKLFWAYFILLHMVLIRDIGVWLFLGLLFLIFPNLAMECQFVKSFHRLVLVSETFAPREWKSETFLLVAHHSGAWLCYEVLNRDIVLLEKPDYLHIFLMSTSLYQLRSPIRILNMHHSSLLWLYSRLLWWLNWLLLWWWNLSLLGLCRGRRILNS